MGIERQSSLLEILVGIKLHGGIAVLGQIAAHGRLINGGNGSLLVNHLAGDGDDVVLEKILRERLNVLLGVDLSDVARTELVLCELRLLLDALLITFSQRDELLELVEVAVALSLEVVHGKGFRPDALV